MTEPAPGVLRVQEGLAPPGGAAGTEVTREIVPDEVYMGKRLFGKESQYVIIEAGTYGSERELADVEKTILSKREKAKGLRNIVFNSVYCDGSRRIYIVSISPSATLRDVLSASPFSLQEKKALALDVCREVRKVHGSSDVHDGLSLERVLVGDRELILLTNYFPGIPASVENLLPREIAELGDDASRIFPKTRYDRESVDVFATALMMYEIFTGQKPANSREYVLTEEERRVLGQSLRTAPGSFAACFGPFGAMRFDAQKAGEYAAVLPRALSALAASAALCARYLIEAASRNTLKEYLAAALDKTCLEEYFGSTDCLASGDAKRKNTYVFPSVLGDAGRWFSKNGGRYNYVPVLGDFFGFFRKPEERAHCPKLDELIKRLGAAKNKKGSDYCARIQESIGEKRGKNILNEMTELHRKQRLEQAGRRRITLIKRSVTASAILLLAAALLVVGYLHYYPAKPAPGRYGRAATPLTGDNREQTEAMPGRSPAAAQAPTTKLYIAREDAKTYTVPESRSSRIDVGNLTFVVLDSLNPSTRVSADSLPFFKIASVDKKFVLDYPNRLLLSAKGRNLKTGVHHVPIEAHNPECTPIVTDIEITVVREPDESPPPAAQPQPSPSELSPQPRILRPSAVPVCDGVYKIEHAGQGNVLDDIRAGDHEKFTDQGGTIYVYRQSAKKIITANLSETSRKYVMREYVLSNPQPVDVSEGDLISRERRLLEKCVKEKK
jgi:hypothetical protein